MAYSVKIHSDPVIICPYDSNHKIARSRIQRHLVKCEKNFPVGYKRQCPYDATHRFFEHELEEHIASCPMKFSTNLIPSRLPDIESDLKDLSLVSNEWDDPKKAAVDPCLNSITEPTLDTIQPNQHTAVLSTRGNSLRAKRFSSSLRQPFGYSESLMLDLTDQTDHSIKDDTDSVMSDMAVGRGQAFASISRGQFSRGVRVRRRGVFRGRPGYF